MFNREKRDKRNQVSMNHTTPPEFHKADLNLIDHRKKLAG
jgi:hypothetical protein